MSDHMLVLDVRCFSSSVTLVVLHWTQISVVQSHAQGLAW